MSFVSMILLFLFILILMLYWPRAVYESANPFLSGEDYWIPWSRSCGPWYCRGPRFWQGILANKTEIRVEREISERLRNFSPGIVVRIKNDELSLFGQAPSHFKKEQIERSIKTFFPHFKLQNNIAVIARSEYFSTDSSIN